uniref:Uncharacterized protein n=1 Tax=Trichogramma kaykai TaxID=54128 RepID=A0ABD2XLL0_9HYME
MRHGSDPNAADAEGATPLLIILRQRRNEDLVRVLFELAEPRYGPVRLDRRDELGDTPLHHAMGLFETTRSPLEPSWYDIDEEFAREAKKTMIRPGQSYDDDEDDDDNNYDDYDDDDDEDEDDDDDEEDVKDEASLSLYDLVRLRPEEAQKVVTSTDYLCFSKSS